jgi:hypothetical protein
VLAFVLWSARRRRLRMLIPCVVAVLAISAMSSCGGGGGSTTSSPVPTVPPATSVQFTVSAPYSISTGPGSSEGGAVLATVTVNINP